MLLIDAKNAFNEGSRKMMAWVARHEWPSGCRMLLNFYRHHSSLVIRGECPEDSMFLLSKEGVTQGCPFSMVGYGLLVLPLIRRLQQEFPDVASPWYADDAMAAGKLDRVMEYFRRLEVLGPAYGYLPEETKSILVVREDLTEVAKAAMVTAGAKVEVVNGHRYLGGYVGDAELEREWIRDKVVEWCEAVKAIGVAAQFVPQSAYAAMQRSLQQEWQFVLRVVPDIAELFTPLETALHDDFFAKLVGSPISSDLREYTTAPIKLGGCSIPDPRLQAKENYTASQCETAHLIGALRGKCVFRHVSHKRVMETCREEMRERKAETATRLIGCIGRRPGGVPEKLVDYQQKKGVGGWLAAMPSADMCTTLSPVEFRDGLRLRLDLPLLHAPTHCDGCGAAWSVSHSLSCPFGGLVNCRHNEARDEVMDTCCMAYTESQVRDEPLINLVRALVTPCGKAVPAVSVVPTLSKNQKRRRNRKAAAEKAAKAAADAELREEGKFVEEDVSETPREEAEAPEAKRRFNALDGDGEEKEEAVCGPSDDRKRADMLVRNVWSNRTDCLVDFVVTDPNQPSYRNSTPEAVLRRHEQRKKKKYLPDCQAQRRDFTPFVVTTEGMLGREADCFLKRVAMKLAKKWSRPYSQVVGFIKTRFAVALARAKSRCIRGSRIKPERSSFRVQFDDGAGLGLYSTME